MATLQELAASVAADAKLQAQRIHEETEGQVQRISAETEELVARRQAELDDQARRERDEKLQRILAQQRLAASQERLLAKQQLLDAAFAQASKELGSMSPSARKAMLERLWTKACSQIAPASVVCAKQDEQFFAAKRVRTTPGDMLGGFLARSSDGTTQVDMRFETLLAQYRSRNTARLGKVLFG
jgi:vacuolar-type H+-ATPase subunit E/Vma4